MGGSLQGPICTWLGVEARPDNAYTVKLVMNHGAEYALSTEPTRTVAGFAATTTTSIGTDPNYYCGLLVDVAPGRALSAAYDNDARDYPGMNRKLACDKAQLLAQDLVTNLREQQHR
jgi:hypothetical protein